MANEKTLERSILALSRTCRSISPSNDIDASEDLRKSCEDLARRFNLALIVLFGSYAAGSDKAGSDLDIAVLLARTGTEEPIRIEAAIARELWMELHPACELDLIILNSASSLLKRNVARTGIPLYACSQEVWRAFRLRAFREFEDDAPFRNRRWQQVKRRIAHGQAS
jgi:uncharacterized protein